MCTVTYIPTSTESFILSANRDESPDRSPDSLSMDLSNGQRIIYPRDTKAGGTWIAGNDQGKAICLLNGAFKKHRHQPPYRISRGIMALAFFNYPSIDYFVHSYEFKGIEPFTLILYDGSELAELRWDVNETKHLKVLDSLKPQIWSSATLYDSNVREWREQVFQKWLSKSRHIDLGAIQILHQFSSKGDPENDFVMNRNGKVMTVSITNLSYSPHQVKCNYFELQKGVSDQKTLYL